MGGTTDRHHAPHHDNFAEAIVSGQQIKCRSAKDFRQYKGLDAQSGVPSDGAAVPKQLEAASVLELRFILSKLGGIFASSACSQNLDQSLVAGVQAAVKDSTAYGELSASGTSLASVAQWDQELDEWLQQHDYADFPLEKEIPEFKRSWGKFVKATRDDRKAQIEVEIKHKETEKTQLLNSRVEKLSQARFLGTRGELHASNDWKQQENKIEGIDKSIETIQAGIESIVADLVKSVIACCIQGECNPDVLSHFSAVLDVN